MASTSTSPSCAASRSSDRWPTCSRSKQPLVKTTRLPCDAPRLRLRGELAAAHDLAAAWSAEAGDDLAPADRDGADLAHRDAGGDVGDLGRPPEAWRPRRGRGEHRDRGVAGAGDVEDRAALRRDVTWGAAGGTTSMPRSPSVTTMPRGPRRDHDDRAAVGDRLGRPDEASAGAPPRARAGWA